MFAFLITAFVTGSKLNLINSATVAQFNNCVAAKNSQFAIIKTSQLKPDLRYYVDAQRYMHVRVHVYTYTCACTILCTAWQCLDQSSTLAVHKNVHVHVHNIHMYCTDAYLIMFICTWSCTWPADDQSTSRDNRQACMAAIQAKEYAVEHSVRVWGVGGVVVRVWREEREGMEGEGVEVGRV